ncbi:packaged DNA stabilization protein [Sphingomonas sp. GB1N7]|uniref:packaged DNA stabilization protein n=1 Tax=Parasphingomonas caseinilytica TaxID=3096158 RepID=UPI002FCB1D04
MPAVPLGLQSYDRKRGEQPETRLVNLYLETDESGASPDETYRLQRPGLVSLADFPGPIRGIYQSDNVLSSLTVVVSGGEVYTTDGANITLVGPITDDGDLVTIAATFERVGICSGGQFWSFDGDTLVQIPLPDDQNIVDLDVLNSYFLVGLSDGRFFWLEPGSDTFDALNFATAESLPDGITAVRRLKDDMFLFGSRSIEVWQSTGDADATFQRAPGRLMDRGAMSRDCVCLFDNSVLFVGDDAIVYRLSDTPQRISTFGIEEKIRRRSDLCTAFVFTSEGHKFYCLRIPSVGTFAYDAATKIWCEFSTLGQTVWLPVVAMDTNAGPLCAGANGKLYRLDPDAVTDDGVTIERLVTGTIAVPAIPVRNTSFALGVGCEAPAIFKMRYRDERDADWSPAIMLDARTGSDILNAYRLGATKGPSRTFEISTISPTNIRISGALANESWSV